MFTIAARLAANYLRDERRNRRSLSAVTPATACEDPCDENSRIELHQNIWATASRCLSDTERAALWLSCVEDMPATIIARVLGKNALAVRVLMHRAKRKLARNVNGEVARDASSVTASANRLDLITSPLVLETAKVNHNV